VNTRDYDDVLTAVCGELQKFNSDNVALSPDTDISRDLDIDSVAVMDLIFALEERYDVSVPLNQLSEVNTVGELAQLVHRLTGRG